MSHYKMKYASIKDTGIWVTICPNNISPMYFERVQYGDGDIEKSLANLIKDMLHGNIVPYPSCPLYDLEQRAEHMMRKFVTSAFEIDLKYKTDIYTRSVDLVSKHFAAMHLGTINGDMAVNTAIELTHLSNELKEIPERMEKKWAQEKILRIDSAWRSNVFKDWTVFCIENNLFLAPSQNYKNNGFLEKSDEAIKIGYYDWMLFQLVSGHYEKELEAKYQAGDGMLYAMELVLQDALAKNLNLPMNNLPYPSFPYEKYGFSFKKEEK